MQDVIPDLWPDEIARTTVPTPLAILNIQANKLRDKTHGIIEAQVQRLTDNIKKREFYYFDIVAPALEGYTLRLFTAHHEVSLVYPILVMWGGFEEGFESASTPEEMYHFLQIIFGSRDTKSRLMSLIAQSNERRAILA